MASLILRGRFAFGTRHLKLNLAGFLLKFGNAIIGLFREAIGENWTRQLSNDAFYTGVINTKDGARKRANYAETLRNRF